MNKVGEIVKNYYDGLRKHDLAGVKFHMSLVFDGPLMKMTGGDEYRKVCEKMFEITKDVKVRRIIASDQEAAVHWELDTGTSAGVVSICDLITVSDGAITEIKCFYDPRKLVALMETA
jgi:ketosteroid isomerase-like protein